MNKRIAALVVSAVLALLGPATASNAASPVAHSSCSQARIAGQSKCIARGQFCKRSAQRDYQRYGYSCSKRDRNGRYHLQ
jgi:hypothetical protein